MKAKIFLISTIFLLSTISYAQYEKLVQIGKADSSSVEFSANSTKPVFTIDLRKKGYREVAKKINGWLGFSKGSWGSSAHYQQYQFNWCEPGKTYRLRIKFHWRNHPHVGFSAFHNGGKIGSVVLKGKALSNYWDIVFRARRRTEVIEITHIYRSGRPYYAQLDYLIIEKKKNKKAYIPPTPTPDYGPSWEAKYNALRAEYNSAMLASRTNSEKAARAYQGLQVQYEQERNKAAKWRREYDNIRNNQSNYGGGKWRKKYSDLNYQYQILLKKYTNEQLLVKSWREKFNALSGEFGNYNRKGGWKKKYNRLNKKYVQLNQSYQYLEGQYKTQQQATNNWRSKYKTLHKQGSQYGGQIKHWQNKCSEYQNQSKNWQNQYEDQQLLTNKWRNQCGVITVKYREQQKATHKWRKQYTALSGSYSGYGKQLKDWQKKYNNLNTRYKQSSGQTKYWQDKCSEYENQSKSWQSQYEDQQLLTNKWRNQCGNWQKKYNTISSGYSSYSKQLKNWQNKYNSLSAQYKQGIGQVKYWQDQCSEYENQSKSWKSQYEGQQTVTNKWRNQYNTVTKKYNHLAKEHQNCYQLHSGWKSKYEQRDREYQKFRKEQHYQNQQAKTELQKIIAKNREYEAMLAKWKNKKKSWDSWGQQQSGWKIKYEKLDKKYRVIQRRCEKLEAKAKKWKHSVGDKFETITDTYSEEPFDYGLGGDSGRKKSSVKMLKLKSLKSIDGTWRGSGEINRVRLKMERDDSGFYGTMWFVSGYNKGSCTVTGRWRKNGSLAVVNDEWIKKPTECRERIKMVVSFDLGIEE